MGLLVTIAMLLTPWKLKACDICGCGVGSYYLGILPEFKKRFIGMRYQHKGLITHLNAAGGRSYLTTDETYHITELWGAVNLGKKFRVMGFLPYNINQRLNQSVRTSQQGLGDVAAYGYYKLFDKRGATNNHKFLVHSLWGGLGLKLPTGRYNNTDKNVQENIQNTFQLGTGSVDVVLNALHDIRLQDAGLNTNVSYKVNTVNQYKYRYGNKLTVNMLGYYKFRLGTKSNIAPNTGLLYEQADKDEKDRSRIVEESGGYSITYTLGTEWSYKRVFVGANYQIPVFQYLANGKAKSLSRLMLHVSFSL
jgi:hypothetical protein